MIGRCRDLNVHFKRWLNELSLSHESNKKDEKRKTKQAIKLGNGHKNS